MKNSRLHIMFPLLLILIVSACGPSPQQAVPTATATLQVENKDMTEVTNEPATDANSEGTSQSPQDVMPTSRGPNLIATDPSTVNLASGQLQLVEFFRFT